MATVASMSLGRRTCGASWLASRPRIAPRQAGRWRRWRRPGGGRLRVRRSRRAGGPRSHRGGTGGRSRQRDAGAADGRRERPERPAGGEPRPARHGGDPRQRDDDPRRGGVRGAGDVSCGMVRRMKPAPVTTRLRGEAVWRERRMGGTVGGLTWRAFDSELQLLTSGPPSLRWCDEPRGHRTWSGESHWTGAAPSVPVRAVTL